MSQEYGDHTGYVTHWDGCSDTGKNGDSEAIQKALTRAANRMSKSISDRFNREFWGDPQETEEKMPATDMKGRRTVPMRNSGSVHWSGRVDYENLSPSRKRDMRDRFNREKIMSESVIENLMNEGFAEHDAEKGKESRFSLIDANPHGVTEYLRELKMLWGWKRGSANGTESREYGHLCDMCDRMEKLLSNGEKTPMDMLQYKGGDSPSQLVLGLLAAVAISDGGVTKLSPAVLAETLGACVAITTSPDGSYKVVIEKGGVRKR